METSLYAPQRKEQRLNQPSIGPHTKLDSTLESILSTETIRARANQILDLALSGSTHFQVDLDRLDECADYVCAVTRENYPDENVPFHSRLNHFRAGGIDRVKWVNEKLSSLSNEDRTRAFFDLVVISVLLDAGAGMRWKYVDSTGEYSKSEGLAVASLEMFLSGSFSNDSSPRVDADAMIELTPEALSAGFQISTDNPLEGLEGRLSLLHSFGKTLRKNTKFFTHGRPSDLIDVYRGWAKNGQLRAELILRGIQLGLGPIWPGRIEHQGVNLGDVWAYGPLEGEWIPFHKLSQWLSYSLITLLEWVDLEIINADGLTGLPEYRNGGLFLDLKVLTLRDPTKLEQTHSPDSELIIEWRALTVALLDRLVPMIRKKMNWNEADYPTGKVLEGGTWSAGRKIAKKLRTDGGPPLNIKSDGTVF